jgi:hypothetical protein
MRTLPVRHSVVIVAVLACVVFLGTGCGKRDDCAETIDERIPTGASLQTATTALLQCGFKTELDTRKRTVYGDKKANQGSVTKRTQVLIQLDGDDRVVSVKVSEGLVGP